MIRVAVIGFGYWGPKLARNFRIPGRSEVVAVCDLDAAMLARAAELYPGLRMTNDVNDAIGSPEVDAVVVATPARSHFEVAWAALRAGKHVLLSKPMTETSEQAKRLIDEAERQRLVLLVDHTFVYTSAVQKLGEIIAAGQLGELYYYDSTRVNFGLFRTDTNVLWDLAIHDLAIIDHVLATRPLAVSVTGASNVRGSPENLAHMTLFLPEGATAHVNVNWLAPVKLRQTVIGGSRKIVVYDDLLAEEKLRVYDKGITVGPSGVGSEAPIGYRQGGMTVPPLAPGEALATEAEHFVDCIEKNAAPITGGAMALRLIELLEHATTSMRQQGRPVEIRPLNV